MSFPKHSFQVRRWLPGLAAVLALTVALGTAIYSGARAQSAGPLMVQEMRQANGLTVLVAPQPALASFTATIHYTIGSAYEWQGLFGAAELLGQLLLDGTSQVGTRDPGLENYLLGQLDQLDAELRRQQQALMLADARSAPSLQASISGLQQQAGTLMAQLDGNSFMRITEQLYAERGAVGPVVRVTPAEVQLTVTLPSEQLSFFFGVERMRILGFSSRGFYSARRALQEKRRLEESRPANRLIQGVLASVFQVHPFGRFQAGSEALSGIGRDELEMFNRLVFRPSQRVIALAGGVRTDEARELAARYFGDIPRTREPELLEVLEPRQSGQRRIEVVADSISELLMAFPRASLPVSQESPLIPLLLELLGDPGDGVLSALYAEGLASRVTVTRYPSAPPLGTRYPDAILIGATALGRTTPEQLEARIRVLLDGLAQSGPSPAALEGARRRLLTRLAAQLETPSLLAPLLARAWATSGDAEALNRLYVGIETVSASQLQEASRILFHEHLSTVGILHADRNHDEAEAQGDGAGAEAPPAAEGHIDERSGATQDEGAGAGEAAANLTGEGAQGRAAAPPVEADPMDKTHTQGGQHAPEGGQHAPAEPAPAQAEGGH